MNIGVQGFVWITVLCVLGGYLGMELLGLTVITCLAL